MEQDICENRHGGNPESAEAWLSTPSARRASQRFYIWQIAVRNGARGVTTDEIAEILATTPNVVSGRLSELKKSGFLTETNMRRPTRMGRMARVFVAKTPVA